MCLYKCLIKSALINVIYSWYILNYQVVGLNLSFLIRNKNKNRKFIASYALSKYVTYRDTMIVELVFLPTNNLLLLNAMAHQIQVMVIALTQAASGDWEAGSLFKVETCSRAMSALQSVIPT